MNLEWPLKSFTVPHIYSLPGQTWIRQLIVFSDASEDTCAAAAYLRATDGETVCHLQDAIYALEDNFHTLRRVNGLSVSCAPCKGLSVSSWI